MLTVFFSHGWRYVRKRGVKVGGTWYQDEKLKEIVGEYVAVSMYGYWCTEVSVARGVWGLTKWYCSAKQAEEAKP